MRKLLGFVECSRGICHDDDDAEDTKPPQRFGVLPHHPMIHIGIHTTDEDSRDATLVDIHMKCKCRPVYAANSKPIKIKASRA